MDLKHKFIRNRDLEFKQERDASFIYKDICNKTRHEHFHFSFILIFFLFGELYLLLSFFPFFFFFKREGGQLGIQIAHGDRGM
jgi:hypothetical protein